MNEVYPKRRRTCEGMEFGDPLQGHKGIGKVGLTHFHKGGLLACCLARAINEKCLRVSKLALVAKQAWFSGHYGRTWIDHNENGLLRNVIEESQSSSPGFLPSLPDEGDINSIQAGLA